MRTIDITVSGDPETAKKEAIQALESRKFRLTWHDEWNGVAERGNKVANVVAGALAQYFKIALRIFSGTTGETIVRFEQRNYGLWGGGIGAVRIKRNMDALRDEVGAAFRGRGILLGVTEQP